MFFLLNLSTVEGLELLETARILANDNETRGKFTQLLIILGIRPEYGALLQQDVTNGVIPLKSIMMDTLHNWRSRQGDAATVELFVKALQDNNFLQQSVGK